ncbi:low molecular weight protein-tyrosine-phosphatase [Parvibaculum sp.]|uniref:low molecular weight protein-tyrosine-phosphatase n=1 Tax=Parvibaculum sp. TaxID=2024848 RepID=UPI000C90AF57|nr:low molecular weight protein-tyrosine-phosphatase [Parvibaculum sp.]MAB13842.1 phosphotyrosine protein phosphatase [Parvibaculum sp.]
MSKGKRPAVLFVCLGNICRSPTAEAVFRARAAAAGLDVEIDSAGTGAWHVGKSPDPRAQAAGEARGYDLSPLRARQVKAADFQRFDLILAMDEDNYEMLCLKAPGDVRERIVMMMDFAPDHPERSVPDPYYGGDDGFAHVLDMLEEASDGLIAHLSR